MNSILIRNFYIVDVFIVAFNKFQIAKIDFEIFSEFDDFIAIPFVVTPLPRISLHETRK